MCNALWECLKCPGKVFCCCCECACSMLMGFICSGLVLIIVIGLIVYFTVYHNKDNGNADASKLLDQVSKDASQNFKSFFKSLQ